jgi:hypothetical protein
MNSKTAMRASARPIGQGYQIRIRKTPAPPGQAIAITDYDPFATWNEGLQDNEADAPQAKVLTKDATRRIAVPELPGKADHGWAPTVRAMRRAREGRW